jgi:TRAP-type C4-dicarboxylate transport system permease small subunit
MGRDFIDRLEAATHALNRLSARAAGLLILAIVLALVKEIFSRYVLGAPTTWIMDYSRFALLYVFFLSVGPALQSGHHVDVDLFDPLIPPRLHRAQRLLGDALTLIFGTVLLWQISAMTQEAFETGEMAFAMTPVPLKYVYWIGPVGTLLFVLTASVRLVRRWQAGAGPVGS